MKNVGDTSEESALRSLVLASVDLFGGRLPLLLALQKMHALLPVERHCRLWSCLLWVSRALLSYREAEVRLASCGK